MQLAKETALEWRSLLKMWVYSQRLYFENLLHDRGRFGNDGGMIL